MITIWFNAEDDHDEIFRLLLLKLGDMYADKSRPAVSDRGTEAV